MKTKINVAVLGTTGYVGLELIKILLRHQHVNINFLGSDSFEGQNLSDIENNKNYFKLPILKKNELFDPSLSDYVFLALPHSVSNKFVKTLYNKVKIIDLSADFRFDDLKVYSEHYDNNHLCGQFLDKFVYGLVEINRSIISKANNIAVPGCYPTSVLLPLVPLLKNKQIISNNIIIDTKSGYSGAGKKFDKSNIFLDNDLNFYNYNTNSHRHIPEIKQELLKHETEDNISFSFNPHILPNFRGMMSTIYCDLKNNISKSDIIKLFSDFDKKNYFIKLIDNDERLDFFSTQNTNFCKLKILDSHSADKIIIVSVIDNLIKGASGQAIQCFNLMENYDETTALI